MRPLFLVLCSFSAFAGPKVIAVIPPENAAQAGPSVDLETKLGHSEDVTIISRGAQLEILRGVALKPTTKVDDKLAVRIGRLSGADVVVYGAPFKLCRLPAGACAAAGSAEAVLQEIGAKPAAAPAEGWADETKSAQALAAYASCRAAVSLAIEQVAIKGRKAQAKNIDADCKKAVSADAAYAPAKAALAAANALEGDANAEGELRDAMEKLPTDWIPATALFHLLVGSERHQDALDALAGAEQRAPQLLDLKRLRAERLFQMDQFKEAQPELEAALKLAPRSPYLHWRLSYTLHMAGNDEAAVAHAEEASRLAAGGNAFYDEEYASRLIDVGRYAEAQAVLEPLRRSDPTWGRVALRLGYALHKQGKSKEALPLFAAAAKAKPRDPREKDDKTLAALDTARAHAKLGDANAAFKQLQALKAEGALSAVELKDSDFDAIRGDARFAALQ